MMVFFIVAIPLIATFFGLDYLGFSAWIYIPIIFGIFLFMYLKLITEGAFRGIARSIVARAQKAEGTCLKDRDHQSFLILNAPLIVPRYTIISQQAPNGRAVGLLVLIAASIYYGLNSHWILLGIASVLLFALINGLTVFGKSEVTMKKLSILFWLRDQSKRHRREKTEEETSTSAHEIMQQSAEDIYDRILWELDRAGPEVVPYPRKPNSI